MNRLSAGFRLPRLGLGGSGGGAPVPWYLAGGVPLANVEAAWQPIGAANLAASYLNLINPGTNDLAPNAGGTSHDPTKGLISTGSYFSTGLNFDANHTVVFRWVGATASSRGIVTGSWQVYFDPLTALGDIVFGENYTTLTGAGLAAGYGALNGTDVFVNGTDVGNLAVNGTAAELKFNCGENTTPRGLHYLAAAALYNINLTQPQIAAIGAAMMALP